MAAYGPGLAVEDIVQAADADLYVRKATAKERRGAGLSSQ
jgi:hypothetical protein